MGGEWYSSVEWLIEDHNYLCDERITNLEDRIFLTKSLNGFYLSVQVLINLQQKVHMDVLFFGLVLNI